MNKKLKIGIGLGLGIIVFIILALVAVDFSSSSGTNELELTYETYGGAPHKWEYKIEDESIVKFVKTKDITPDNEKNLVGGVVYTNYIFKGLKQGKTTITFKYVNVVDNTVEKEETVNVMVDKNKNISLNVMP